MHYAGEVTYDIAGFVEKNKDSVSQPITECLSKSGNNIVAKMFAAQVETTNNLKGNSLSNQFRTQLETLIKTLKKSAPRYVRCIKPNSKFSSEEFDSWDVCK